MATGGTDKVVRVWSMNHSQGTKVELVCVCACVCACVCMCMRTRACVYMLGILLVCFLNRNCGAELYSPRQH